MSFEKPGYHIRNQQSIYFLTFTVVDWIDIFTRKIYKDILIDNLKICQTKKGLVIHCYVIMSNHLHLIASANASNLSDIIRDYKSFTSKKIVEAIKEQNESRRHWLLKHLQFKGGINPHNDIYQLWTNNNHPEEIISYDFMRSKADYIHENPVRAGLVEFPHEYLYSSAKNYAGMESLIEVDLLW
jgi:putative transposase